MKNFKELLEIKGTIWRESSEGIELNMNNLSVHVETFVVANSRDDIPYNHIFNKFEFKELEPCLSCNNSSMNFYECSINVPNKLGFDATKYNNMWVKFAICKECKEFFLMQDIMIQDGEDVLL